MRMWLVDPKTMCRQHLLGEHVELHMIVGVVNKGKSIKGYLESGLIDLRCVSRRHGQLVREMARRGFRHKSPLGRINFADASMRLAGRVDAIANAAELRRRCGACRKMQDE